MNEKYKNDWAIIICHICRYYNYSLDNVMKMTLKELREHLDKLGRRLNNG